MSYHLTFYSSQKIIYHSFKSHSGLLSNLFGFWSAWAIFGVCVYVRLFIIGQPASTICTVWRLGALYVHGWHSILGVKIKYNKTHSPSPIVSCILSFVSRLRFASDIPSGIWSLFSCFQHLRGGCLGGVNTHTNTHTHTPGPSTHLHDSFLRSILWCYRKTHTNNPLQKRIIFRAAFHC